MLNITIHHKQFPGRTPGHIHVALKDVQLALQAGEFVCLIGPSGCGKSTLINIINGLDADFDGNVALNGSAPRGGIATMFQNPRLMPWLTVIDNVRLVLEHKPPAEATRKARELLTAMELGDVLEAYPNRLSGGMQRRVALARAFSIEPRLLLMDEPFVSLDAPVANRLRSMLIELWQHSSATVLFVTHDMHEALALADRVLFMSGSPGRMVLEVPVNLPRPRNSDDPQVSELYKQLLLQHPDLLAGLVDDQHSRNPHERTATN
jgi:NitT/TauT family transport system ATP-binding protein